MEEKIMNQLAGILPYKRQQIQVVLSMLEEGNTVPFIARYRKERTGSLDEVQIREIEVEYHKLCELEKRKQSVLSTIDEQGKLTPELQREIEKATTMQQVEDLYRPYKQKRRTKAAVARENGLEPLAQWIWNHPLEAAQEKAATYVNDKVPTIAEVMAGVHEILAERISDNAKFREWVRQQLFQHGQLHTTVKDEEKDETKTYHMYYNYEEPIQKMPAHRVLAVNRGEKEGILRVHLIYDKDCVLRYFNHKVFRKDEATTPNEMLLENAIQDSLKRFIIPAVEREIRSEQTKVAEAQAIHVFGLNLRQLLLQPPLTGQVVMGFDPAYRTGCKLAIVDETGKVLAIDVIYPTPSPKQDKVAAANKLKQLVEQYQVTVIAIGNGTASRESEQFVSGQIKQWTRPVYYVMVSEAGASVYSASEAAREEFPDLPVEKRSAVSIARRLQDPLAELVKIDPKSIGVGQYQHDVSQKALDEQLKFVVETAVNQVGVDVNTASPELLRYVSGLTTTTARNIVQYRNEYGEFTNRTQLKKVPRLGPKAYEQAIGFLRIRHGDNPLDQTEIHPESYAVAKDVLEQLQLPLSAIGTIELNEKLSTYSMQELAETCNCGIETMRDIVASLQKPSRDPRDEMPAPILRQDVLKMEDLKAGMELKGTVRNVVDFGAFVDIGVKQDGLVHLSKLAKKFIQHPSDVVSVGDIVTVWVESVDLQTKRIALTMIPPQ